MSFLASDPKFVIPKRPKTYGECSLEGNASQFPLMLLTVPENLSMSLSQEIHFTCFLVSKASFSFYSSSEITKMISFIFDSRKSKAFLTYILSLFKRIWSFMLSILSITAFENFSKSFVATFVSILVLIYLMFAYISVCNIFSF